MKDPARRDPGGIRFAAGLDGGSGGAARDPGGVIRDFISRGGSLNILITEDEIINQKFLEKSVEKIGFHCDLADDGLAAMEMLRDQPYDIILLDMQLPGMSGEEILAEMKAAGLDRRTYIIAQTAYSMKGDEDKIRALGCHAFLNKPVDIVMLTGEIAAAIARISGA